MEINSLRNKIISCNNKIKIKAGICFQNKTPAILKLEVSIKFHKFFFKM